MNCTIEDCNKTVLAKGLCEKHYRKQWTKIKPSVSCAIKDCSKVAVARGLCSTHYQKAREDNTLKQYGRHYVEGQRKLPEYKSYRSMLARCYNPNNIHYKDYGGRGIRITDEWLGVGGFKRFYEHIGPRPVGKYSIDRINNNGNYEPGNVRWATPHQQAANTRRNLEHVGVYYAKDRDKWYAHLDVNGTNVINRYYDTKDEAIAVRKFAEHIYKISN